MRSVRYYSSYEQIQKVYCTCIENELFFERPFFENPDVNKYLKDNGMEYLGNYLFYCKAWDPPKQFVTFLHYILQMSCLMLFAPNCIHVINNPHLFEYKYLRPVLKKMDVYMIADDLVCYNVLLDMADDGIELVINGKSTKGMDRRELDKYLFTLHCECSFLNREVDAKYFPADFEKTDIFTPYRTSYQEYIIANETERFEKETLDQQTDIDWGMFSDITVLVNGQNKFSAIYRRYPVHYLYEIDGKWKYISENSYKNPSLNGLFDEIFSSGSRFDVEHQKNIDVSEAKKIFALVLDCDETCYVKEYWKHVAFVAKYDKVLKTIEICDQPRGILEFHELLQKSTDLSE